MAGGLLQLIGQGAEDTYLIGNPQISFFKIVYRRYTNFSMELIELLPETTATLNTTTETTIDFKIGRNGDLVKDVYLTFTLPSIYSNHDGTPANCNFRWINRIGEMIIQEMTFLIGGLEVDKQYGEWLHIWNELTLAEGKRDGYNRMIGNIPEIYNPEKIVDISSYPASMATTPSIIGRKIIVPLAFFFNKTYGQALPLIAMQYDAEPVIRFIFRPINQLYTLVDGNRKAPLTSEDTHNFGRFLSHGSTTNVSAYDFNFKLEANYIFLDKDERKRFALVEHQYIIKTLNREVFDTTPTTGEQYVKLNFVNFQHPTTALYWIARRDDAEAVNEWSNYTNYPLKDYNPLFSYSIDSNPYGSHTYSTTDKASYLNKHLIKDCVLKLNGFDRFETKTADLFNYTTGYQHFQRVAEDGIYVYSFQLLNDDKQPSGSCNFSRFNTIEMGITLNPKTSNTNSGNEEDYNINIHAFSQNYNILRIMGGIAGLQFSR